MELISIGFKAFDKTTYITQIKVSNDMGDHGRACMPLKIIIGNTLYGKFAWASKKTGKCIYEEITEKEYNTHYQDVS